MSKPIEATMCGLSKWHKKMFEKLGWMMLAKSRGEKDVISHYKKSVKKLHRALEYKISQVVEEDKKSDLLILLKHVKILEKCICNM